MIELEHLGLVLAVRKKKCIQGTLKLRVEVGESPCDTRVHVVIMGNPISLESFMNPADEDAFPIDEDEKPVTLLKDYQAVRIIVVDMIGKCIASFTTNKQ